MTNEPKEDEITLHKGWNNVQYAIYLEICFQLTCELNDDNFNMYDRGLYFEYMSTSMQRSWKIGKKWCRVKPTYVPPLLSVFDNQAVSPAYISIDLFYNVEDTKRREGGSGKHLKTIILTSK